MKGTITINLPEDVKSLGNAEIRYTGIYRYGSVEKLKCTAMFKEPADEPGLLGNLTISVKYGLGVLSYNVKIFEDNMIGEYKLSSPPDNGKFQLRKGGGNNSSWWRW